ncbi:MAG: hypothetical protein ACXVO9_09300 [Bacteroidia bacterium]
MKIYLTTWIHKTHQTSMIPKTENAELLIREIFISEFPYDLLVFFAGLAVK